MSTQSLTASKLNGGFSLIGSLCFPAKAGDTVQITATANAEGGEDQLLLFFDDQQGSFDSFGTSAGNCLDKVNLARPVCQVRAAFGYSISLSLSLSLLAFFWVFFVLSFFFCLLFVLRSLFVLSFFGGERRESAKISTKTKRTRARRRCAAIGYKCIARSLRQPARARARACGWARGGLRSSPFCVFLPFFVLRSSLGENDEKHEDSTKDARTRARRRCAGFWVHVSLVFETAGAWVVGRGFFLYLFLLLFFFSFGGE